MKSGYAVKLDDAGDITVAEYIGEDLDAKRNGYLQFVCNNCSREIDATESEELEIEKAIEDGYFGFYIVCKQCGTHYKLFNQLVIKEERCPGSLKMYKM